MERIAINFLTDSIVICALTDSVTIIVLKESIAKSHYFIWRRMNGRYNCEECGEILSWSKSRHFVRTYVELLRHKTTKHCQTRSYSCILTDDGYWHMMWSAQMLQ
jgi:hypothetical protein